MAIRTGIIFCALLLGCLAVPVPEEKIDLSIFFDSATPEGPEGRIVGGNQAAPGSHPWMVAFTTGGNVRSLLCGGSILNTRTVLTAAHCIVPVRTWTNQIRTDVRVSVGTNVFNQGGQTLTVNGFAVHPQYNGNTIKNDIGTLRTASNINFNQNVRAIAPSWSNVGGGVQSRVAGWGRTGATAPASVNLLEIEVPTLGGQQCINAVRQAEIELNTRAPAIDPAIEICTFHSRGRGTCRGDSGSALVQNSNNQQIGIVSWGFPCALGAPDVYVRVSGFQNWLNQNTF